MLYFVVLNVKEMVLMERDRWITVTWAAKPANSGRGFEDPSIIDVNEMDQISLSLRSNRDQSNIKYDGNTRRYVRVYSENLQWSTQNGKR